MLVNISNLYMEYGERKLFSIKSQQIYKGDKIGIVGENGAGKTSLLNIIADRLRPPSGKVDLYGTLSYIEQLGFNPEPEGEDIAYRWRVGDPYSGGEIMRSKISVALGSRSDILLCDEPTSNLDEKGIVQLEKALRKYQGAVVLVSHDRKLMDSVCNSIWEISHGEIKIYRGNYSDYRREKTKIMQNRQKEYDKYVHEKEELERAIIERTTKAGGMTHTPGRMGNSEARLHRMDVRQKAGKVSGAVKNLKTRLDKLEVKENPKRKKTIVMTGMTGKDKSSKKAIRVHDLSFAYGDEEVLKNISFTVAKGDKVCITGDNGSGKTTLLELIANGVDETRIAPHNTVGYFRQNCIDLDEDRTIMEVIMEDSMLPEHLARTVLGRLGIGGEDVYKKVAVLSGGERCKVKLASLISMNCSILILDEPTNYLDIHVLEALEDMLSSYEGTLLFVSHDRYFRESILTRQLHIENSKIAENELVFDADECGKAASLMVLELKKIELIGRIQEGAAEDRLAILEDEYDRVMEEIKEYKV